MTLSQKDLDLILIGLDKLEGRYLDDYHKYRIQGNQPAAQDCLDYFHYVYQLRQELIDVSQNGTDVAYTLE